MKQKNEKKRKQKQKRTKKIIPNFHNPVANYFYTIVQKYMNAVRIRTYFQMVLDVL